MSYQIHIEEEGTYMYTVTYTTKLIHYTFLEEDTFLITTTVIETICVSGQGIQ